MKRPSLITFLILIHFSLSTSLIAQSFSEGIETLSATQVNHYEFIDIDNDGYKEALGASVKQRLFYYDNIDGELDYAFRAIPQGEHVLYIFTTGDIDGDGDGDLLTHNVEDDQILLLYNDGTGQFDASLVVPNAQVMYSNFEAHDINDDGLIDIITGDEDELHLLVQENDTTFTSQILFDGGPYQYDIADMNNDSADDLIIYDESAQEIGVRYNQGDNTFSSFEVIASNTSELVLFLVEDVGNDGDEDIFLFQSPGPDLSFIENSSGVLTLQDSVTLDGWIMDRWVYTDYDGDGSGELIWADGLDIRIVPVDPEQGFLPAYTAYSPGFYIDEWIKEDVNGDGILEVVSISSDPDRMDVFYGEGILTGQHELVAFNNFLSRDIIDIDLDDDGFNDIVFSLNPSNIYINLVTRLNGSENLISRPTPSGEGLGFIIFDKLDCDSDGDEDLIIKSDRLGVFFIDNESDLSQDEVVILADSLHINGGVDSWKSPLTDHSYIVVIEPSVTGGDPDGNSKIWLTQLDASGEFLGTDLLVETEILSFDGPQVGDLDGDGLPEIAYYHQFEGLVILWSQSDGGFNPQEIGQLMGFDSADLDFLDADQDGDLDLFVSTDGPGLQICVNEGGVLSDPQTIFPFGPYYLHGQNQLIGNDFPDLLLTELGAIRIVEGLGNLNYGQQLAIEIGGYPKPILIDLNHDGLNDLLVKNDQGTRQTAFLNTTVVSIEDYGDIQFFKAYPNPTSSGVTLETPMVSEQVDVGIIDSNGRLIYQKEISIKSRLELPQSVFPGKGVYVVELSTETQTSTRRIVVE